MARFETFVAAEHATVFDARIWDFVARMVGCAVPVHVVRHTPLTDGANWMIEMDDEARLAEFADHDGRTGAGL